MIERISTPMRLLLLFFVVAIPLCVRIIRQKQDVAILRAAHCRIGYDEPSWNLFRKMIVDVAGKDVLYNVNAVRRYVGAFYSELTLADFEALSRLKDLEDLHLEEYGQADCAVNDSIFDYITPLTKLRKLHLSWTRVTGRGLSRLQSALVLEELNLVKCPLTQAGIAEIGALRNLREIDLTWTPTTDSDLQHLGRLHGLRILGITGTKVTGTGLEHLRELTSLQYLWLGGCPLSNDGLKCLRFVPTVERLSIGIRFNKGLDLGNLRCLTRLKYLFLSGKSISDGDIFHLGRMETLEELDVSNTGIGDLGCLFISRQFPGLQRIEYSGTKVTELGEMHLRCLPHLDLP